MCSDHMIKWKSQILFNFRKKSGYNCDVTGLFLSSDIGYNFKNRIRKLMLWGSPF